LPATYTIIAIRHDQGQFPDAKKTNAEEKTNVYCSNCTLSGELISYITQLHQTYLVHQKVILG